MNYNKVPSVQKFRNFTVDCCNHPSTGVRRLYCKVPKFSDPRNLCCNLLKIQTKRPKLWVYYQNDANGIANSEDPDQTAPLGSRSALFAKTYLSENLGSLRYVAIMNQKETEGTTI